jgi:glutamate--cysteine ligase
MNVVEGLLKDHKRSSHRWIGLEIERLFIRQAREVLDYEADIRPALEQLLGQGWRIENEWMGRPLAITKALHVVSLEPGSQLEVSLAPQASVGALATALRAVDQELLECASLKGAQALELGLNPWDLPDQRRLLPSPRYNLMDHYFAKIPKGRGREMMRLSTGLQVNIDYASEAEGIDMFQAALWVSPFLATLFANSPFYAGKRGQHLSERAFVWELTDPLRSGFQDFFFDSDLSLATYSDWVQSVPLMYAYDEYKKIIPSEGASLKDLPEKLQGVNALGALRQIFTEVRFKPCCVEVRTFDQVSAPLREAAAALVVGLLYSAESRQKIRARLGHLKAKECQEIRLRGADQGLKDPQIFGVLCELVEWAQEGLHQRGMGEEVFLKPAQDLIDRRMTPAEDFLEKGSFVL